MLLNCPLRFLPTIKILISVFVLCCTGNTFGSEHDLNENINFSRDHVMVLFDPGSLSGNDMSQENELISLIKLISKRFSKILIDPIRGGSTNISSVANAIATLNSKSGNYQSTKLWVNIPFSSDEDIYSIHIIGSTKNNYGSLKYVEDIKDALDSANNISSGSVEGIILNSDYFLHKHNHTIVHNNVKEVNRIFRNSTKFQYKLCLLVTDRLTLLNHTQLKIFSNILNAINASHMMTVATPNSEDVDMAVNVTIEKYQNIMENLTEIIRQNSSRNIVPIFRTGYPDTKTDSMAKSNYEDIVQYWKSINDWAIRTNSIVAFTEAFDNPKRNSTTLKQNDNENSEDSFTEKVNIPDENLIENLIESDFDLAHDTTNISYFLQNQYFDFRQNPRFFVNFNPPIKNASSNALEVSLVTIFQKFSRISLRDEDLTLNEMTAFTAAWKYNDTVKAMGTPINISIHFTLPTTNNTDNQEDKKRILDNVKTIARLGNNTVSSAQLIFSTQISRTVASYIGDVVLANKTFDKTDFSYKFGVELPFQMCANSHISVVQQMLPYVKLVTLKHLSSDRDVEEGVVKTMRRIRYNFESCKKKILRNHSGVEVGLSVSWRDTNKKGKKDYESFVRFWGNMGEWAEKNGVTLVMADAFDKPGKAEKFGWWEIKSGKEFLGFVEKRQILLDELPPDFGEDEYSHKNGSGSTTIRNITSKIGLPQYIPSGVVTGIIAEESEWSSMISWVIPTVCAIIVAFILATVVVWKVRKNPRQLTKEEVTEFIEGNNRFGDHLGEDLYVNSKYNREQCEIPLQNIGFESVIGSGKFAIFYKAIMADNIVAVKVPKKGCAKQYFKSMLMETKIMANVGDHVNVLKFHGAIAQYINRGILYIINEYCENGSLYCYLRTMRYNLEAREDENARKLENVYELHKFAYEISSGMHYLSERDIIHGDLSTLNVLLDGGNICKIYNFGLTRKLDENGEYVKRTEETFPWRWIAIETLKHKIVTGRSDVWSYGVTLWEIFSLGRVPYKTHAQEGFLEKLEKGLRLKRPKYATQDVYDNMMHCWSKNPADRPPFQEQAEYFLLLMKEEYDTFDEAKL